MTIEAVLVPESLEKQSREIKRDVLKEFNEGNLRIPWVCRLEKIRFVEVKILERPNSG